MATDYPEIVRPSWADPFWAINTNDFSVVRVDLDPAVTKLILPNDPTRWSITFVSNASGAADILIAPHTDPSTFGFFFGSGPTMQTFTVFTHGALVCTEWYAFSPINLDIVMYISTIRG